LADWNEAVSFQLSLAHIRAADFAIEPDGPHLLRAR